MRPAGFRRRAVALVALVALAFAEGCYSYQRPMHPELVPGTKVQVTASSPIAAQAGSQFAPTPAGCRVRVAAGTIESVRGDTLTLSPVLALATTADDGSCRGARQLTLVASREVAQLAVFRINKSRTTLIVGGIALGVLIAAASSSRGATIDPGNVATLRSR